MLRIVVQTCISLLIEIEIHLWSSLISSEYLPNVVLVFKTNLIPHKLEALPVELMSLNTVFFLSPVFESVYEKKQSNMHQTHFAVLCTIPEASMQARTRLRIQILRHFMGWIRVTTMNSITLKAELITIYCFSLLLDNLDVVIRKLCNKFVHTVVCIENDSNLDYNS